MPFDPSIPDKKKRRTSPKEQAVLKSKILELTLSGFRNVEIANHNEVGLSVSNRGQSQRVWQIQQELIRDGKLKKDATNGRLVVPYEVKKKHEWSKVTQEIAKSDSKYFKVMWDVMMSKRNGKGEPDAQTYANNFLTVCNTVNIHPDEIIDAKDSDGKPNYIKKMREVMIKFNTLFAQGKVVRNNNYKSMKNSSDEPSTKHFLKALRKFVITQDLHIPQFAPDDILSGTKGKNFGAYNQVGLTDIQFDELLEFVETEAKDYGYVGMVALMPEMITRTISIIQWLVKYETEFAEIEGNQVNYDFVKGFYESKTEKSKSLWDKFIIHPKVRNILHEVTKERAGKPLVDYGTNKTGTSGVQRELNRICREYYIKIGKLDESTRLPKSDPSRKLYPKGTEEFFYDTMGAYVLRHTGAHIWCRRSKYDYGFVADLGWTDMNTLRQCYAGKDIKHGLQSSTCMYCNPPQNVSVMKNQLFCSYPHAFIYYSNGCKSKVAHS